MSKTFDVDKSTSTPKSVDFKFQPTQTLWQQLDCYHEFDDIYPVMTKKTGVSVREQFQVYIILSNENFQVFLNLNIQTLYMLSFSAHIKNSIRVDRIIHSILRRQIKRRYGYVGIAAPESQRFQTERRCSTSDTTIDIHALCKFSYKPFVVAVWQVSYLSKFQQEAKLPDTVEYIECEGTTHFSGIVASRIYLNPKATVDDATTAIKQDVIRSLASRFTMHCDALIDDNLLPEGIHMSYILLWWSYDSV